METTLAFSLIPDTISSPVPFLLLGGLSAALMGAAKAGFAGSVGILSVPMMIYACGGDAPLAVGILLPLLIVCDYVSLPFWWRKWSWPTVRGMLGGMALGTAVGTAVFWLILRVGESGEGALDQPRALLKLLIGVIALGFVALQTIRARSGRLAAYRPRPWHGLLAGSGAGLTSTLAHSAGPITTVYLLPQEMPKQRFVATTVLYYWIGNQAKVAPYLWLGALNAETAAAAAALAPAIIAGALLGIFLHHRVNQKVFTAIVYVLLAVMGAHMTVTSVLKLIGVN